MSAFSALNIVGNTHLSHRDRFTMSLVAPLMYLGFYVVTAVEYLVVLQLIVRKIPAAVRARISAEVLLGGGLTVSRR